ncbi:MAG: LysM peptidoglycan-binding domain-containing protein, partial [Candidatus Omnitrophica bacterium]|nr:LysM peptidoglycan-binding domain-containing protein [Candidatus Omnitrophota bacterium]
RFKVSHGSEANTAAAPAANDQSANVAAKAIEAFAGASGVGAEVVDTSKGQPPAAADAGKSAPAAADAAKPDSATPVYSPLNIEAINRMGNIDEVNARIKENRSELAKDSAADRRKALNLEHQQLRMRLRDLNSEAIGQRIKEALTQLEDLAPFLRQPIVDEIVIAMKDFAHRLPAQDKLAQLKLDYDILIRIRDIVSAISPSSAEIFDKAIKQEAPAPVAAVNDQSARVAAKAIEAAAKLAGNDGAVVVEHPAWSAAQGQSPAGTVPVATSASAPVAASAPANQDRLEATAEILKALAGAEGVGASVVRTPTEANPVVEQPAVVQKTLLDPQSKASIEVAVRLKAAEQEHDAVQAQMEPIRRSISTAKEEFDKLVKHTEDLIAENERLQQSAQPASVEQILRVKAELGKDSERTHELRAQFERDFAQVEGLNEQRNRINDERNALERILTSRAREADKRNYNIATDRSMRDLWSAGRSALSKLEERLAGISDENNAREQTAAARAELEKTHSRFEDTEDSTLLKFMNLRKLELALGEKMMDLHQARKAGGNVSRNNFSFAGDIGGLGLGLGALGLAWAIHPVLGACLAAVAGAGALALKLANSRQSSLPIYDANAGQKPNNSSQIPFENSALPVNAGQGQGSNSSVPGANGTGNGVGGLGSIVGGMGSSLTSPSSVPPMAIDPRVELINPTAAGHIQAGWGQTGANIRGPGGIFAAAVVSSTTGRGQTIDEENNQEQVVGACVTGLAQKVTKDGQDAAKAVIGNSVRADEGIGSRNASEQGAVKTGSEGANSKAAERTQTAQGVNADPGVGAVAGIVGKGQRIPTPEVSGTVEANRPHNQFKNPVQIHTGLSPPAQVTSQNSQVIRNGAIVGVVLAIAAVAAVSALAEPSSFPHILDSFNQAQTNLLNNLTSHTYEVCKWLTEPQTPTVAGGFVAFVVLGGRRALLQGNDPSRVPGTTSTGGAKCVKITEILAFTTSLLRQMAQYLRQRGKTAARTISSFKRGMFGARVATNGSSSTLGLQSLSAVEQKSPMEASLSSGPSNLSSTDSSNSRAHLSVPYVAKGSRQSLLQGMTPAGSLATNPVAKTGIRGKLITFVGVLLGASALDAAEPKASVAPSATPAPAQVEASENQSRAPPVIRHVIKRGDTLSAIAQKYNTTVKALKANNSIKNPRAIKPGQVILIAQQPAKTANTDNPKTVSTEGTSIPVSDQVEVAKIVYAEAANDPAGRRTVLDIFNNSRKNGEGLLAAMKRGSTAYRSRSREYGVAGSIADAYNKDKQKWDTDFVPSEVAAWREIMGLVQDFKANPELAGYDHYDHLSCYPGKDIEWVIAHLKNVWGPKAVDYSNYRLVSGSSLILFKSLARLVPFMLFAGVLGLGSSAMAAGTSETVVFPAAEAAAPLLAAPSCGWTQAIVVGLIALAVVYLTARAAVEFYRATRIKNAPGAVVATQSEKRNVTNSDKGALVVMMLSAALAALTGCKTSADKPALRVDVEPVHEEQMADIPGSPAKVLPILTVDIGALPHILSGKTKVDLRLPEGNNGEPVVLHVSMDRKPVLLPENEEVPVSDEAPAVVEPAAKAAIIEPPVENVKPEDENEAPIVDVEPMPIENSPEPEPLEQEIAPVETPVREETVQPKPRELNIEPARPNLFDAPKTTTVVEPITTLIVEPTMIIPENRPVTSWALLGILTGLAGLAGGIYRKLRGRADQAKPRDSNNTPRRRQMIATINDDTRKGKVRNVSEDVTVAASLVLAKRFFRATNRTTDARAMEYAKQGHCRAGPFRRPDHREFLATAYKGDFYIAEDVLQDLLLLARCFVHEAEFLSFQIGLIPRSARRTHEQNEALEREFLRWLLNQRAQEFVSEHRGNIAQRAPDVVFEGRGLFLGEGGISAGNTSQTPAPQCTISAGETRARQLWSGIINPAPSPAQPGRQQNEQGSQDEPSQTTTQQPQAERFIEAVRETRSLPLQERRRVELDALQQFNERARATRAQERAQERGTRSDWNSTIAQEQLQQLEREYDRQQRARQYYRPWYNYAAFTSGLAMVVGSFVSAAYLPFFTGLLGLSASLLYPVTIAVEIIGLGLMLFGALNRRRIPQVQAQAAPQAATISEAAREAQRAREERRRNIIGDLAYIAGLAELFRAFMAREAMQAIMNNNELSPAVKLAVRVYALHGLARGRSFERLETRIVRNLVPYLAQIENDYGVLGPIGTEVEVMRATSNGFDAASAHRICEFAGIPRGADEAIEYAFSPGYAWYTQKLIIDLMLKLGMIPGNAWASLHINTLCSHLLDTQEDSVKCSRYIELAKIFLYTSSERIRYFAGKWYPLARKSEVSDINGQLPRVPVCMGVRDLSELRRREFRGSDVGRDSNYGASTKLVHLEHGAMLHDLMGRQNYSDLRSETEVALAGASRRYVTGMDSFVSRHNLGRFFGFRWVHESSISSSAHGTGSVLAEIIELRERNSRLAVEFEGITEHSVNEIDGIVRPVVAQQAQEDAELRMLSTEAYTQPAPGVLKRVTAALLGLVGLGAAGGNLAAFIVTVAVIAGLIIAAVLIKKAIDARRGAVVVNAGRQENRSARYSTAISQAALNRLEEVKKLFARINKKFAGFKVGLKDEVVVDTATNKPAVLIMGEGWSGMKFRLLRAAEFVDQGIEVVAVSGRKNLIYEPQAVYVQDAIRYKEGKLEAVHYAEPLRVSYVYNYNYDEPCEPFTRRGIPVAQSEAFEQIANNKAATMVVLEGAGVSVPQSFSFVLPAETTNLLLEEAARNRETIILIADGLGQARMRNLVEARVRRLKNAGMFSDGVVIKPLTQAGGDGVVPFIQAAAGVENITNEVMQRLGRGESVMLQSRIKSQPVDLGTATSPRLADWNYRVFVSRDGNNSPYVSAIYVRAGDLGGPVGISTGAKAFNFEEFCALRSVDPAVELRKVEQISLAAFRALEDRARDTMAQQDLAGCDLMEKQGELSVIEMNDHCSGGFTNLDYRNEVELRNASSMPSTVGFVKTMARRALQNSPGAVVAGRMDTACTSTNQEVPMAAKEIFERHARKLVLVLAPEFLYAKEEALIWLLQTPKLKPIVKHGEAMIFARAPPELMQELEKELVEKGFITENTKIYGFNLVIDGKYYAFIRSYLPQSLFKEVIIHEIGASFGLRHKYNTALQLLISENFAPEYRESVMDEIANSMFHDVIVEEAVGESVDLAAIRANPSSLTDTTSLKGITDSIVLDKFIKCLEHSNTLPEALNNAICGGLTMFGLLPDDNEIQALKLRAEELMKEGVPIGTLLGAKLNDIRRIVGAERTGALIELLPTSSGKHLNGGDKTQKSVNTHLRNIDFSNRELRKGIIELEKEMEVLLIGCGYYIDTLREFVDESMKILNSCRERASIIGYCADTLKLMSDRLAVMKRKIEKDEREIIEYLQEEKVLSADYNWHFAGIGFCGNVTLKAKGALNSLLAKGNIALTEITDFCAQKITSSKDDKQGWIFYEFNYGAVKESVPALQRVSIFATDKACKAVYFTHEAKKDFVLRLERKAKLILNAPEAAQLKKAAEKQFGDNLTEDKLNKILLQIALYSIVVHEDAELRGIIHDEAVKLQKAVMGYEFVADILEELQNREVKIIPTAVSAASRNKDGRLFTLKKESQLKNMERAVLAIRALDLIWSWLKQAKPSLGLTLEHPLTNLPQQASAAVEEVIIAALEQVRDSNVDFVMVFKEAAGKNAHLHKLLKAYSLKFEKTGDGTWHTSISAVSTNDVSIYDYIIASVTKDEDRLMHMPLVPEEMAASLALQESQRLEQTIDIIVSSEERALATGSLAERKLAEGQSHRAIISAARFTGEEFGSAYKQWAESIALNGIAFLYNNTKELEVMMKEQQRKGEDTQISEKNITTLLEAAQILEEAVLVLLSNYNYFHPRVKEAIWGEFCEERFNRLEKLVADYLALRNAYNEREVGKGEEPIAVVLDALGKYLALCSEKLRQTKAERLTQDPEKKSQLSYRNILLEQVFDTVKLRKFDALLEILPFDKTLNNDERLHAFFLRVADVLIRGVEFGCKFKARPDTSGPVILRLNYVPTPQEFRQILEGMKNAVKGVINSQGSALSHYVFAAKSLGIPVAIVKGHEAVLVDEEVALITKDNRVVVNPNSKTLNSCIELEHLLEMQEKYCAHIANSRANGWIVFANVEDPQGIKEGAKSYNADGFGLYRTEASALFNKLFPPSLEELTREYGEAYENAAGRSSALRALDPQSDKMPDFVRLIGYSGDRFCIESPLGRAITIHQMRSVLRLRRYENRKFMLPVVETGSDVEAITGMLLQAMSNEGITKDDGFMLGVMIETPAAVENIYGILPSSELFSRPTAVKFFSLGTNDLITRLYNVDRQDPQNDGFYAIPLPRVIRIIKEVTALANANNIKVTICGDLASLKEFWIVYHLLQAQGVELTLSMPPALIPVCKTWLYTINKIKNEPLMQEAFTAVNKVISGKKISAAVLKELVSVENADTLTKPELLKSEKDESLSKAIQQAAGRVQDVIYADATEYNRAAQQVRVMPHRNIEVYFAVGILGILAAGLMPLIGAAALLTAIKVVTLVAAAAAAVGACVAVRGSASPAQEAKIAFDHTPGGMPRLKAMPLEVVKAIQEDRVEQMYVDEDKMAATWIELLNEHLPSAYDGDKEVIRNLVKAIQEERVIFHVVFFGDNFDKELKGDDKGRYGFKRDDDDPTLIHSVGMIQQVSEDNSQPTLRIFVTVDYFRYMVKDYFKPIAKGQDSESLRIRMQCLVHEYCELFDPTCTHTMASREERRFSTHSGGELKISEKQAFQVRNEAKLVHITYFSDIMPEQYTMPSARDIHYEKIDAATGTTDVSEGVIRLACSLLVSEVRDASLVDAREINALKCEFERLVKVLIRELRGKRVDSIVEASANELLENKKDIIGQLLEKHGLSDIERNVLDNLTFLLRVDGFTHEHLNVLTSSIRNDKMQLSAFVAAIKLLKRRVDVLDKIMKELESIAGWEHEEGNGIVMKQAGRIADNYKEGIYQLYEKVNALSDAMSKGQNAQAPRASAVAAGALVAIVGIAVLVYSALTGDAESSHQMAAMGMFGFIAWPWRKKAIPQQRAEKAEVGDDFIAPDGRVYSIAAFSSRRDENGQLVKFYAAKPKGEDPRENGFEKFSEEEVGEGKKRLAELAQGNTKEQIVDKDQAPVAVNDYLLNENKETLREVIAVDLDAKIVVCRRIDLREGRITDEPIDHGVGFGKIRDRLSKGLKILTAEQAKSYLDKRDAAIKKQEEIERKEDRAGYFEKQIENLEAKLTAGTLGPDEAYELSSKLHSGESGLAKGPQRDRLDLRLESIGDELAKLSDTRARAVVKDGQVQNTGTAKAGNTEQAPGADKKDKEATVPQDTGSQVTSDKSQVTGNESQETKPQDATGEPASLRSAEGAEAISAVQGQSRESIKDSRPLRERAKDFVVPCLGKFQVVTTAIGPDNCIAYSKPFDTEDEAIDYAIKFRKELKDEPEAKALVEKAAAEKDVAEKAKVEAQKKAKAKADRAAAKAARKAARKDQRRQAWGGVLNRAKVVVAAAVKAIRPDFTPVGEKLVITRGQHAFVRGGILIKQYDYVSTTEKCDDLLSLLNLRNRDLSGIITDYNWPRWRELQNKAKVIGLTDAECRELADLSKELYNKLVTKIKYHEDAQKTKAELAALEKPAKSEKAGAADEQAAQKKPVKLGRVQLKTASKAKRKEGLAGVLSRATAVVVAAVKARKPKGTPASKPAEAPEQDTQKEADELKEGRKASIATLSKVLENNKAAAEHAVEQDKDVAVTPDEKGNVQPTGPPAETDNNTAVTPAVTPAPENEPSSEPAQAYFDQPINEQRLTSVVEQLENWRKSAPKASLDQIVKEFFKIYLSQINGAFGRELNELIYSNGVDSERLANSILNGIEGLERYLVNIIIEEEGELPEANEDATPEQREAALEEARKRQQEALEKARQVILKVLQDEQGLEGAFDKIALSRNELAQVLSESFEKAISKPIDVNKTADVNIGKKTQKTSIAKQSKHFAIQVKRFTLSQVQLAAKLYLKRYPQAEQDNAAVEEDIARLTRETESAQTAIDAIENAVYQILAQQYPDLAAKKRSWFRGFIAKSAVCLGLAAIGVLVIGAVTHSPAAYAQDAISSADDAALFAPANTYFHGTTIDAQTFDTSDIPLILGDTERTYYPITPKMAKSIVDAGKTKTLIIGVPLNHYAYDHLSRYWGENVPSRNNRISIDADNYIPYLREILKVTSGKVDVIVEFGNEYNQPDKYPQWTHKPVEAWFAILDQAAKKVHKEIGKEQMVSTALGDVGNLPEHFDLALKTDVDMVGFNLYGRPVDDLIAVWDAARAKAGATKVLYISEAGIQSGIGLERQSNAVAGIWEQVKGKLSITFMSDEDNARKGADNGWGWRTEDGKPKPVYLKMKQLWEGAQAKGSEDAAQVKVDKEAKVKAGEVAQNKAEESAGAEAARIKCLARIVTNRQDTIENRTLRANEIAQAGSAAASVLPSIITVLDEPEVAALTDKDENLPMFKLVRAVLEVCQAAEEAGVPSLVRASRYENPVVRKIAAECLVKLGPKATAAMAQMARNFSGNDTERSGTGADVKKSKEAEAQAAAKAEQDRLAVEKKAQEAKKQAELANVEAKKKAEAARLEKEKARAAQEAALVSAEAGAKAKSEAEAANKAAEEAMAKAEEARKALADSKQKLEQGEASLKQAKAYEAAKRAACQQKSAQKEKAADDSGELKGLAFLLYNVGVLDIWTYNAITGDTNFVFKNSVAAGYKDGNYTFDQVSAEFKVTGLRSNAIMPLRLRADRGWNLDRSTTLADFFNNVTSWRVSNSKEIRETLYQIYKRAFNIELDKNKIEIVPAKSSPDSLIADIRYHGQNFTLETEVCSSIKIVVYIDKNQLKELSKKHWEKMKELCKATGANISLDWSGEFKAIIESDNFSTIEGIINKIVECVGMVTPRSEEHT